MQGVLVTYWLDYFLVCNGDFIVLLQTAMSIRVGKKVTFDYIFQGRGVHGWGVVQEVYQLQPNLTKYTIKDALGKYHYCFNREVKKIKQTKPNVLLPKT